MRAASRTLRTAWVAAALLALPAACRPVSLPSIFTGMEERTEWVMGTRLRIVVPASARSEETLVLAFAAARELDALLSDYQPQTPLARLNATAGAPFAVVDPRLFAFLRRAVEDARRTEGLFDIAVGALVQGYRRGTIVDAKTLKDARSRSGSRLIELEAPNRARLAWPGVRLDPGGIGKGYAVDAIVAVLRARRVDRAFVDFGGSSVFGLGAPPERRGWPVLVPGVEPERPLGILWLKDEGFSSSESMPPPDAQKSKTQAHIVDPRTGQLVERARFALCVSASGTDAEVVTKLLVIGPELLPTLPLRYPGSAALVHEAGKDAQLNEALRGRFTPIPGEP